MKKIAVIDIGTNSMRLLIATQYNGQIVEREKIVETTRMGQGVDKNGNLSVEVIDRNFMVLKKFLEKASRQGVEKTIVFATSALRDANNRREFTHRVKIHLGLDIDILSGDREAEIGFRGVSQEAQGEELMVIDIGGGSTEFIVGDKTSGMLSLTSVDIGALRMTEKFITKDPVEERELENLEEYIKSQLLPIKEKLPLHSGTKVLGIAGTITTVSAIKQKMRDYDWRKIHKSKLTYEEVSKILVQLISLSLEERKALEGLQPKRADIIIGGTMILKSIMEVFGVKEIEVSEVDNLEGMVYTYLVES